MMKKIALHWQIIIGMILGVIYGVFASNMGYVDFTSNWIKPWGVIFVNLLKLIAVPLVLASLIKGVTSLSDISKLSRIGGKTIFFYLISTVIAVSIGLLLVNTVNPGIDFDKDNITFTQDSQEGTTKKIIAAEVVKQESPLQFLIDIIPTNIFAAASSNGNMLQVIFFAILFGISIVMLPSEKTIYVRGFFDGVNDIILKIVDLVMLVSPYGVFALLGALIVDFGASSSLFIALAKYSITVVVGLLLMIFCIYPLVIKIFTKVRYFYFFKAISPAQMLAFSTSSSAATLPVTIKCVQDGLKVPKKVSDFVLPIGATVNMDGTSLYQAIAVIFLAQFHGVDLSVSQQLGIVATTTLASIGSAAVPSAGLIMLMFVLNSVGLNPMWIVIVYPIDRILDMCRTVINVSSDATVAAIIAKTEEKLS